MSTYKEIVGKKIKKVTSDPSDSVDGQMWYNSTTGSIRGLAITEGWSSSSSLSTARRLSGAFGASQTAAAIVAGQMPGSNYFSNTEHYDGTGFSNSTAYPASGYSGSGAGTQTAGLIAGGYFPGTSRTNAAAEYDGSSWTSTNNLPGAMDNMAGCGTGTQTNVIFSVGRTPSSGNSGTNNSVTYDGTNFGSGPNINTARMFLCNAGAGTGTAALICGGFIDPSPNSMTNSEEYDGSSWSNGGTLNTSVGFSAAWGTQTNAVAQVDSPNTEGAEKYDGTSWTALPDIGIASGSYYSSAGATGDAGFITSLGSGANQTAEFNRSTTVITAGSWATGGSLNTARRNVAGAGIQTSALAFGGEGPQTGKTELYNGTSWSEQNDLNTARNTLGGTGTSTAAIAFGGEVSGPSSHTETWNGSSWTTSPNSLNTPTRSNSGFGTTSSAINMGGLYPSPTRTNVCEEWGGTSWTIVTSLPTAVNLLSGFGVETAGVACGGSDGSLTAATYEWGGSSWTTSGSMNTARQSAVSGTGSQTDGLLCGGQASPGVTTVTEGYDGTSWSTRPSMGTARSSGSGLGPSSVSTAGLFAGGYAGPPGDVNTTEEFTGETTASNVKDFTTS